MTEGISSALAHHVASARYEDLSPRAIEATKKSLLDALGVSLGASGLGEGCAAFAALAIEAGGRPESTILGYSRKAPAAMAAFANGSMAHALDFEDAFDGAPVHPNAAVVPAALAVAQAMGGVSGKELLLAQAVGCDLVCRLGLALTADLADYGWYPPPILSAFGAAAAAARLLRLTEAQVLDAFSLILCQATCSAELKYSPHSLIRAVRDGFAAQAGVVSALLARKGVTGFEKPFEGKAGFFALYARGNYDPAVLLKELGRDFLGERVSYKPWPACRGTHAFIEGALGIAAQHALNPAEIAEIRLAGGPLHRMLTEPVEQKRAPSTAIDAKFSLPFTVSTALVFKDVTLEHFFPEALSNPTVLALARKVFVEIDPGSDSEGGVTTIRTHAGNAYSVRVKHALGHPENPIRMETLVRKFLQCASHAHDKPQPSRLKGIVDAVASLDSVRDAGRELIDAHLGDLAVENLQP
jgi:2-methylcitrate dehydratase PrpD